MTDEQRTLLIAMVLGYGDHHDKPYDLYYSSLEKYISSEKEDTTAIIYKSPKIDGQVTVSLPSGVVTSGDSKLIDQYLFDKLIPVLEPLLPLFATRRCYRSGEIIQPITPELLARRVYCKQEREKDKQRILDCVTDAGISDIETIVDELDMRYMDAYDILFELEYEDDLKELCNLKFKRKEKNND